MLAYGLELEDLRTPNDLLGDRPHTWHPVRLDQAVGPAPDETFLDIDAAAAGLDIHDYASVRLSREGLGVRIVAPRELPEDQIVHPLLAFVGAVVARWTGRVAFHAGAVLVDDLVWIVLGEPGGGKSTLMSALNAAGLPVLGDDLAVIEEHTVFAGPRACDLRADAFAATRRGVATSHDPARGRGRWREALLPAPAEAPLGGFVSLRWAEEVSASPVRPSERLRRLAEHDALGLGAANPHALLRLVELPMWELARPRDWQSLERTLDLVASLPY